MNRGMLYAKSPTASASAMLRFMSQFTLIVTGCPTYGSVVDNCRWSCRCFVCDGVLAMMVFEAVLYVLPWTETLIEGMVWVPGACTVRL